MDAWIPCDAFGCCGSCSPESVSPFDRLRISAPQTYVGMSVQVRHILPEWILPNLCLLLSISSNTAPTRIKASVVWFSSMALCLSLFHINTLYNRLDLGCQSDVSPDFSRGVPSGLQNSVDLISTSLILCSGESDTGPVDCPTSPPFDGTRLASIHAVDSSMGKPVSNESKRVLLLSTWFLLEPPFLPTDPVDILRGRRCCCLFVC